MLRPLDNPCLSANIGLGILEGLHLRPTRRIYTLALPRSCQRRPKSTNIWKQLQYADNATNMISRQRISTQQRFLYTIYSKVLTGFAYIFFIYNSRWQSGLTKCTAHVGIWNVVQVFAPSRILHLSWVQLDGKGILQQGISLQHACVYSLYILLDRKNTTPKQSSFLTLQHGI